MSRPLTLIARRDEQIARELRLLTSAYQSHVAGVVAKGGKVEPFEEFAEAYGAALCDPPCHLRMTQDAAPCGAYRPRQGNPACTVCKHQGWCHEIFTRPPHSL